MQVICNVRLLSCVQRNCNSAGERHDGLCDVLQEGTWWQCSALNLGPHQLQLQTVSGAHVVCCCCGLHMHLHVPCF
jgi:hypothetical protein